MKLKYVWCLLLVLPALLCLCACGSAPEEASAGTLFPNASAASIFSHEKDLEVAPVKLAMAPDGIHPQLIAHAGGAVYGYRLTNSQEALENSYAQGFRYMEMDMTLTSDGQIAMIHDWLGVAKRLLGREGVCSSEELHSAQTMAGLTLLTLSDLLAWLEEHPDCTIVTDIKQDDNCALLEQLAREAGPQLRQFIPQAYSFEEYDRVSALGYDRVILTLYRLTITPEELISFTGAKTPWAITIPEDQLPVFLPALEGKGIPTYAHSVNSVDTVDLWHNRGLTGIYTDYFSPAHWIY